VAATSHIRLVDVKAMPSTVAVEDLDRRTIVNRLLLRRVRIMRRTKSRTCWSCTFAIRTLSTSMRRHTTMANVRSVPGRTMTGVCRNRKLVCSVIWRARSCDS